MFSPNFGDTRRGVFAWAFLLGNPTPTICLSFQSQGRIISLKIIGLGEFRESSRERGLCLRAISVCVLGTDVKLPRPC